MSRHEVVALPMGGNMHSEHRNLSKHRGHTIVVGETHRFDTYFRT
jgi:hypothetical protein